MLLLWPAIGQSTLSWLFSGLIPLLTPNVLMKKIRTLFSSQNLCISQSQVQYNTQKTKSVQWECLSLHLSFSLFQTGLSEPVRLCNDVEVVGYLFIKIHITAVKFSSFTAVLQSWTIQKNQRLLILATSITELQNLPYFIWVLRNWFHLPFSWCCHTDDNPLSCWNPYACAGILAPSPDC